MTTIGKKAADRKVWKGMVRERMKHLQLWEESKGKKYEGEEVVRSQPAAMEFVFVCEVCGKVCKSKGGLTVHRRSMHERSGLKKTFNCHRCGSVFKSDANLMNHLRICEGEECEGDSKKCGVCGKWQEKLPKAQENLRGRRRERGAYNANSKKACPQNKPLPVVW